MKEPNIHAYKSFHEGTEIDAMNRTGRHNPAQPITE